MKQALVLLVASVLLVSCGGAAATSEQAESSSAGGETTATSHGATVAWADMTPEQKGRYMAETVMPEMKRLFQEFDGERFAEFDCTTCHGPNAREVAFRMPNGLAPLDMATIGQVFQSEQPMARFMTQRVWPRMAELLEQQPFDMQTNQGFRCTNCHATAEAPASATK